MISERAFIRVSIIFSYIVLALGGLFGFLQLVSRTPGAPKLVDESQYYAILTGHGVLLAILWTAFFILGLAVFVVSSELGKPFRRSLLAVSVILAILGTAIASYPIIWGLLIGEPTMGAVLYTFYPPLTAHPAFYIGLALVLIGSWVFAASVFDVFIRWRKENRGIAIPLGTFGVLATLIIWLEATPGLAIEVLYDLIPMSLFGKRVDVLLDRTLFWYFGHPLVYFWLVPAITAWYALIPRILNTELYSTRAAKLALVIFILTSTPVGLHHQFADPGLNVAWKYLHTVLTFAVSLGSFLTAFNVIMTLAHAGILRGGSGLFGWISRLPWKDPVFSSITLAFILLGLGGVGGIVNASLNLNNVVHNTTWVVGHFHTTVGGAVTLTFIGISYLLAPVLLGRSIASQPMARIQPYLWFIGLVVFSIAYHIAGIYSAPRRTYDYSYGGLSPSMWEPLLQIGMIGGLIFWISGVLFISNILLTPFIGRPAPKLDGASILGANGSNEKATLLDRISLWVIIAVILIIIAYTLPIAELLGRGLSPAICITPAGIKPFT
ncbi:MAG: cbb3-type cytochrome c oxidase subunit I [Desulfurococcales archaeon]|nr:cbb3-type cytochrome c oxidase subunit I [Desulfurococcales archaeon]